MHYDYENLIPSFIGCLFVMQGVFGIARKKITTRGRRRSRTYLGTEAVKEGLFVIVFGLIFVVFGVLLLISTAR